MHPGDGLQRIGKNTIYNKHPVLYNYLLKRLKHKITFLELIMSRNREFQPWTNKMLKAKYETFFVIIFMFINYEYLMYVGMISFIL